MKVVIPVIIAFLLTFKSVLAVTIPTESTLVTSSYVIVPPADILPVTFKLPVKVPLVPVNPLEKLGAPEPASFTIVSTRILEMSF